MKSMNRVMSYTLSLTSLLLVLSVQQVVAQPPAPESAPLPEPQVLEQGPIHEAFAEPLALDAQPTEIIPREPPLSIEEFPPEIRPEGQNVQWIGGYFQWDPEREDFVWVSGFYRDVPPGRNWVPGQWNQVAGGWQWFPGFWTEAELQQNQFLPAPPATLEQGPSSPAPGENFIWAPGTWRWSNNTYAWQAGYWYQARPDWVWVPSHYSCTPRGHVYVGGYWDYPVVRRGLLYAPVYWRTRHVGFAHHYYRPHRVLNTALLFANLFIDRGHHHYYYGFHNRRPGWIHPWGHNHGRHGHAGRRGYYDPIFAHHSWHRGHGGKGKGHHAGHRSSGRDLIVGAHDFHRKGKSDMKLRKLNQAELVAERRKSVERRLTEVTRKRGGGDGGRTLLGEVGSISRRNRGEGTLLNQDIGRERTREGDRGRDEARGRNEGRTRERDRATVVNDRGQGRGQGGGTGGAGRSQTTAKSESSSDRVRQYIQRRTLSSGNSDSEAKRGTLQRSNGSRSRSIVSGEELADQEERERFQPRKSADQGRLRASESSRARLRQLAQQQEESNRIRSSQAEGNRTQQWQQRMEAYRAKRKSQQSNSNSQQALSQQRSFSGNSNSGNLQRRRDIVRGQSPQQSTSKKSSQPKSRLRSFSQQSSGQATSRIRSGRTSSANSSSGGNRSRSRSLSSNKSSKSFGRGNGGGGGKGGRRGKRAKK